MSGLYPPIALVAAVAQNGVIGADGDMPWTLPSDLARFKRLTMGCPIIMGRKTFDAIGKPLPGRHSIVVTRNANWSHAGVEVCHTLDQALEAGLKSAADNQASMICVIGGGEIYRQALERADILHITRIEARPEGDATFPAPDEKDWYLADETDGQAHERDSAATVYETWRRRSSVIEDDRED